MSDLEYNQMLGFVKRGALSPVYLLNVLLHYARTESHHLDELISTMSREARDHVRDVLTMYPRTIAGWSVLPYSPDSLVTQGMTEDEVADIEDRMYRRDKEHIEMLRSRL